MDFTIFLLKIFPLYVLIGIGFLVGRRTTLQAGDLATVNLQYIAPIIFFEAISRLNFSAENVVMPVACFVIMSTLAALVFGVTKLCSKDVKLPYWFSAASVTTNSGYFGIPVFLILFSEKDLGLYMLYVIGSTIFFFTVTHYLILRSHYEMKHALQKIVRLPVLYAMLAGLVCQIGGWHLPPVFDQSFVMLRGAYSVMGMMIIGVLLSKQDEDKKGIVFEWPLIAASNFVRFAAFPLVSLGFVMLDHYTIGLLSPMARHIILLVSLMPMGIDTASIAAQWKMRPERIAALILVNTFLALVAIPLLLPLLLSL